MGSDNIGGKNIIFSGVGGQEDAHICYERSEGQEIKGQLATL